MADKKKKGTPPFTTMTWLFLLSFVVVGAVTIGGGLDVLVNMERIYFILITIGMLTFISVFFSFVYEKAVRWQYVKEDILGKASGQIDAPLKNKRGTLSSEELESAKAAKQKLESLSEKLRPQLWLLCAVGAFLIALSLSLLNVTSPLWEVTIIKLIKGLFFLVGVLFVWWLFCAILCLTVLSKEN